MTRLPWATRKATGVGDHREVLVAPDAHDLVEVQAPRLADDRADRREAGRQQPQARVRVGGDVAPAGHAERGDRRVRSVSPASRAEELSSLGFDDGKPRLDEVHAELVERCTTRSFSSAVRVIPAPPCRRAAWRRRARSWGHEVVAGTGTGSSQCR
jgi:hypothetical protein